jgi:hypothetical protein
MRRRAFIAWLGSSATTWPLPVTAHAQHASKSYRVGLIEPCLRGEFDRPQKNKDGVDVR